MKQQAAGLKIRERERESIWQYRSIFRERKIEREREILVSNMGNGPILLTNISLSLSLSLSRKMDRYCQILSRSPLSLILRLVASQSCMLIYIYIYNIFHYFSFGFDAVEVLSFFFLVKSCCCKSCGQ